VVDLGGDSIGARTVVVASGARLKPLGVCRRVTMVHRDAEPHASARLIAEVAELANVERLAGTTISRILGSDGVAGVELQNLRGRSTSVGLCGSFPVRRVKLQRGTPAFAGHAMLLDSASPTPRA